ncbi:MAG: winged helix-turn-helix transcriptional regulator [Armatimonadetes bacterium]|nr:winged helix-turn-helix transcriptional regulator [Armatimonadota bacterium]
MDDALRRFKAEIFSALAHPTRIAIVELLRDGEITAGAIMVRLGLEQANVSQHLAVLRGKSIVVARREGNQVFYSIRSPLLLDVLASLRTYFEQQLSQASDLLLSIQAEAATPTGVDPEVLP